MNEARPLAVTPGEPAGIGPECLLRHCTIHGAEGLVAVADPALLRDTAQRFGLGLQVREWQPDTPPPRGALACLPVPLRESAEPGRLDPANAAYVLGTLRAAVELVRHGHAHALVTGPVHKGVINDAGIPFTGHTEFLAELAGVGRVVMMLAAGSLRVILVKTHLPLRAVPDAVTQEAVESAARITLDALQRRFDIAEPRLQVLGLNPHAGEGGHLGREDDAVIAPVIARLRVEGHAVRGPVPADTAFTPRALAGCDAVLAMYHDQGLPVLKHAGFGRAVNVTLGLPFIRTSVDHGTALDIAAAGGADPASLGHALALARSLRAA
ncbi:MAG: 4-hydroxythreonine-4-phosphate dehydrogenase PdxA [Gammaproteobacteria bacterium]